MTKPATASAKQYLVMSDFDQTLSFNDSGIALSEMLNIHGFEERINGLSDIRLVQQGGELAYLILHDPEYRRVRRHHLIEVGKHIRLKKNIQLLVQSLDNLDGHRFPFYVMSAAPEEVIQSALEGIVPPDHIFGTRFRYNESTGEVEAVLRVVAGYGKVAMLEELRNHQLTSHDRVVYIGDGSSDVHVMLHLNRLGGLTIAVSENRYITQIARRTVLSDDASSVLVPILEELLKWDPARIRELFESHGLLLRDWGKVRTDSLTISQAPVAPSAGEGAALQ